jgi:hypothetical protein
LGAALPTAGPPAPRAWVALPSDGEICVWKACTHSPPPAWPPQEAWVTFHYQLWDGCAVGGVEGDAVPPPPADAATLGPPADSTGLRGHPVRLCLSDVREALQPVLRSMCVGDAVWARIPARRWAAAVAASSPLPRPPLLVRVELVRVCASMAAHSLAKAATLKQEGTDAFKNENWLRAAGCYKASLRFVLDAQDTLDAATAADEETGNEVFALRTTLHLNMASCHLNRGAPLRAASRCTKALALDPKNWKALVRRAKAWGSVGRHGRAVEDLESAQQILQELGSGGQEGVEGAGERARMVGKVAKSLARAKRKNN